MSLSFQSPRIQASQDKRSSKDQFSNSIGIVFYKYFIMGVIVYELLVLFSNVLDIFTNPYKKIQANLLNITLAAWTVYQLAMITMAIRNEDVGKAKKGVMSIIVYIILLPFFSLFYMKYSSLVTAGQQIQIGALFYYPGLVLSFFFMEICIAGLYLYGAVKVRNLLSSQL